MTKKERLILLDRIDSEGMEYTFIHYSDFQEIKDKKFRELYDKYVTAHNELALYLGVY